MYISSSVAHLCPPLARADRGGPEADAAHQALPARQIAHQVLPARQMLPELTRIIAPPSVTHACDRDPLPWCENRSLLSCQRSVLCVCLPHAHSSARRTGGQQLLCAAGLVGLLSVRPSATRRTMPDAQTIFIVLPFLSSYGQQTSSHTSPRS